MMNCFTLSVQKATKNHNVLFCEPEDFFQDVYSQHNYTTNSNDKKNLKIYEVVAKLLIIHQENHMKTLFRNRYSSRGQCRYRKKEQTKKYLIFEEIPTMEFLLIV